MRNKGILVDTKFLYQAARNGLAKHSYDGISMRPLSLMFLVKFGCLLTTVVAAEAMDGRMIMDEVERRHERPAEFRLEKMTLYSEGKIEARREVRSYAKSSEEKVYKYLIVYDSPAGIAGTAALTWEVKESEDDQWLYLPALKRIKRIIGGAKRRNFMGTDFAFEDLTVEDEDEHHYEREPDRVIDGVDYFVVKAVPDVESLGDSTGYRYRRLFIRKANFFITRVAYYEKESGKHIKSLTITDSKRVDGETWRATDYVMTNHEDKHATKVELVELSFENSRVPARVFEHRYLTSRGHMR